MKVNNPFAGFEQFALSTEEVAMVKGGSVSGIETGVGGEGGGYELQGNWTCSYTYYSPDGRSHTGGISFKGDYTESQAEARVYTINSEWTHAQCREV